MDEKNEKKINKQASKKLYEKTKAMKKNSNYQKPFLKNFKEDPIKRSKDGLKKNSKVKAFLKLDKTENKEKQSEEKKSLEELSQKLKKALEDNLYIRADFENFKKRTYEEKAQLIRYEGESFITALANEVLDDLDRAMLAAQDKDSFENLKKGLEMIQKKISQILDRFGVEVMDPTGKAFDPSYQEALSYIKTAKVPEAHVAETFKKAYKLHGKVIRTAQVVLAKKEEES